MFAKDVRTITQRFNLAFCIHLDAFAANLITWSNIDWIHIFR